MFETSNTTMHDNREITGYLIRKYESTVLCTSFTWGRRALKAAASFVVRGAAPMYTTLTMIVFYA